MVSLKSIHPFACIVVTCLRPTSLHIFCQVSRNWAIPVPFLAIRYQHNCAKQQESPRLIVRVKTLPGKGNQNSLSFPASTITSIQKMSLNKNIYKVFLQKTLVCASAIYIFKQNFFQFALVGKTSKYFFRIFLNM